MLHATAQSEVADIRRLYLKQDIAIVPLGTDLPSLHSTNSRPAAREIGVDLIAQPHESAIRTVLFLSRVHPKKGLQNLFKAWAAIKNDWVGGEQLHDYPTQRVDWRLVIAGPGALGYKGELLALAKILELNTCDLAENFSLPRLGQIEKEVDIVFTGPVYGEDKNNLHGMADLFVLPSFSENFGVVVPDSLAYGVPVLTTKGTPWAELEGKNKQFATSCPSGLASERMDDSICAGRCGWWIDIGVEPLVSALWEAMNMTDEQRRRMGANGRRLVEEKYTWPIVAGDMKRSYELMLSSK